MSTFIPSFGLWRVVRLSVLCARGFWGYTGLLTRGFSSASPLNGEAAELWDKDREEFKRKVLARHRDVEDE